MRSFRRNAAPRAASCGSYGVSTRPVIRRFATVGALAVATAVAGCQSPQPARSPDQAKAFDIAVTRKWVEFNARAQEQDQKSKVSPNRINTKETIFEESIGIETQGSVYHPNFMEFTLGGLFGLLQEDFEEVTDVRDRSSGDDGEIYEFNFESLFLKRKTYPGSVYARRYRALEPRPFLSSLDTTTTNYGFLWQYLDPKMPTSLRFNSTDVDLDPLDPQEPETRQENTSLRFETAYLFSDHNVLSFTYDHNTVEELPYVEYDSDEPILSHRLDFGDRRQHQLESELSYFDQRGTFNIRRTTWRETLRLSHTDSLRSWYRMELQDLEQGTQAGVPPIQQKSYLFSGTLEHRWYESLVSQLLGFVTHQDYDDGPEIDIWGVQPSFDYRKKNPWGVLLANYGFRVQSEDRTGTGLLNDVVDERGTFNDPSPVVLANTNVILSSILITSEDRTIFFRVGQDYRVQLVGDRVEIERVPTGRIADGTTVLIDYVWALGGDLTLDTQLHNFGLRQNFDFGLSPYYRYRRQDQDLSPRDATGVQPEDISAHIYGAEYQKGPVRLIAEYEDHNSSLVPFEALRLTGELTYPIPRAGTARLRTRWVDRDQDNPDRQTKFFTVEGRYRQRMGAHLTLEGAVLYRREDDSLSGDDNGVDVDLSLEWLIRDTEFRVTYESGQYEDDFAEADNQALFVQFRRRF